jgi:putative hydrolase of HD superfamily
MHHLCHELLGWSAQAQEISGLWAEYEAADTPEALLVKDFDKFEMIMQALEYEKCKSLQILIQISLCSSLLSTFSSGSIS